MAEETAKGRKSRFKGSLSPKIGKHTHTIKKPPKKAVFGAFWQTSPLAWSDCVCCSSLINHLPLVREFHRHTMMKTD